MTPVAGAAGDEEIEFFQRDKPGHYWIRRNKRYGYGHDRHYVGGPSIHNTTHIAHFGNSLLRPNVYPSIIILEYSTSSRGRSRSIHGHRMSGGAFPVLVRVTIGGGTN
ncbi:hypothetical protein BGY98DRAFT_935614 [Russula aff. rugulosa BPL654]|nr:hypothetical protein BGY98DRAFT_935614 [Russula aff. rugulosa BPL654]